MSLESLIQRKTSILSVGNRMNLRPVRRIINDGYCSSESSEASSVCSESSHDSSDTKHASATAGIAMVARLPLPIPERGPDSPEAPEPDPEPGPEMRIQRRVLECPRWYKGTELPRQRVILYDPKNFPDKLKNAPITIFSPSGNQLEELIERLLIDRQPWVWSGTNGIAAYLGYTQQGLSDLMWTWNDQKQKIRKLPPLNGDSIQALKALSAKDLKQVCGNAYYVKRFEEFVNNGGNPLPFNPEALFLALNPKISMLSPETILARIKTKSKATWEPWPESLKSSFRIVSDEIKVVRVTDRVGTAGAGSAASAAADASASISSTFLVSGRDPLLSGSPHQYAAGVPEESEESAVNDSPSSPSESSSDKREGAF